MGNRSTLNVEVMKRGTRLLALRYGHLANTPVHRGLGLEQRRFVQNFAWETSIATAAAVISSDSSPSKTDSTQVDFSSRDARPSPRILHLSSMHRIRPCDLRQVIVAGLMAPCLCIESVLPDQANRMEPVLQPQGLGLSGLRKVAEHYST
jgi:hypothetical protein